MVEAVAVLLPMVQSSLDAMAVVDARADVLAVSVPFTHAVFQRFGQRPQPGWSAHRLTSAAPEIDGLWRAALNRGLAGQAVRQSLGDSAEIFLTPMPGGGALLTLRNVDPSADRYRGTFETAIIGLANLSMEGRWLRVNRRYCEILGYNSAELAGKTLIDVTHPDDIEDGIRIVARMRSGEIDQSRYEKRYRRKNGENVWVAVTLQKQAEPGQVPYLIATAIDITDRKRAEQELRAANVKLSFALDCAKAAQWNMDLRSGAVEWMQEIHGLFGIPSTTPPSQQAWLDVVLPEDRLRAMESLRAAMTRGDSHCQFEYRFRHPDKGIRWALEFARIRYADDGAAIRVDGIVVDITALRATEQRLRESERRFEMVMRRGRTGAFALDRHLTYTWFHTCQTGYTDDEILGRHLRDVFDNESSAVLEQLLNAAIAGGQGFHRDLKLQSLRKAEPQYFDLIVEPLRDCAGAVVGLTGITTDITDRIHAQSAVEMARAAAEQANEAKTRFLAAASHDLRQPIQALRLLLHLLTEKATGTDQLRLCTRMGETLASTEGMLAGLMEFASMESGQVSVSLVPLRLDALLKRVGDEAGDAAARKGLSLHVRAMPSVTVSEPMLLERVLRNLLVNAVRYTERGSILLAVRRRGDNYHIEVRDSGCGIAEEAQAEVFEEFRQLNNPERDRSKGMGLGLAIVARTAELLGHRIVLVSREGQGSVFSIVVPCVERPWPAGLSDDCLSDTLASGGRGHVLLVEDDPIQVMALEAILGDAGFVVAAAREAAEAERLIASTEFAPDIILSDYRLPAGISGLQVIASARESLNRFIPAILLTGDTQTAIIEQSAGAGCATLHKPYTPVQLIDAIDTLLRM
jgi:PAS domain S-box-containing protein